MSNENTNNEANVVVEEKKSVKTRLLVLFTVFALALLGLGVRIFYISIVRGDDLRDQAFKQWFQIVNEYYVRGNIYDTKDKKLTANTINTLIRVSNPKLIDEEGARLLARVTATDEKEIERLLGEGKQIELDVCSADDSSIVALLRYKGVSTLRTVDRYYGDNVASHIIGYINESDGAGISGVEKYYDGYLGKDSFKQVGAIMDAQKRILPGYGYVSLHKGTPDDVYLTIDKEVQIIAENAMDKYKYKGSVVVLDSKTGDALAVVSRPNFNQSDLAGHIDSTDKELINKAINMTYPPGSIFKIVVAAGLIEDELMGFEDTFECDGSYTINNTTIKCTAFERGGHGEITFYDAFSKSCNSFFIQGAELLGGERMLELAQAFGVGEPTGMGLGENIGRLPNRDYVKGAGIGNVAIGQGTLEVTPVQIARMTNIIANNGIDVGVKLVKSVKSGSEVIDIDQESINNRVIKRSTANKVSIMMKHTINEGTGSRAAIDGIDTYGKTGSAQAGVNGEKLYAWFSGFFLGAKSEYVIAVVIEDENQGGGRIAAPVFQEIANEMITFGM